MQTRVRAGEPTRLVPFDAGPGFELRGTWSLLW